MKTTLQEMGPGFYKVGVLVCYFDGEKALEVFYFDTLWKIYIPRLRTVKYKPLLDLDVESVVVKAYPSEDKGCTYSKIENNILYYMNYGYKKVGYVYQELVSLTEQPSKEVVNATKIFIEVTNK